ncbi:hypothetical protein [Candidatus Contubernalis alkaliaceticus]|nr:hypothetical protein [Candidatus Contubernalis alkalaceticus]
MRSTKENHGTDEPGKIPLGPHQRGNDYGGRCCEKKKCAGGVVPRLIQ